MNELKEHEEIIEEHVRDLIVAILTDGVLHYPLLVESKYKIILDGHHRYHALKRLGAKRVPIFIVDYSSPNVIVRSWRPGIRVTKDMVIHVALSRKKLPPKTSRHILRGISVPRIDMPLCYLI
ncbi:MAG: transcriptional regulator [Thermoprotei archaeon]|nr:MAG: transcriptional regulator [Thermoprotei archaeon]RLF20037.1 MAG: transcriptional regulator [Thermoprotei archaeon]